jgi:hypothetical protein
VNGKDMTITEWDKSIRRIRVSYWIMHVLPIRHIAALKHRYPFTDLKTILIPKGKLRGRTPRLGEGGLMALMMQMMLSVARDAVVSSDMCVTTICSVCRRLMINCDCVRPSRP